MRLINDDCLDALPTLKANSVHLVFADLPYGVTHNKWDSVIPFEPLWKELLRVGKPSAAFVFTATQPFATALINSQPKLFRYDLIWDKLKGADFPNANCKPLSRHENILVFSRGTSNPMSTLKVTYNPQKTEGKPYKSNGHRGSENYGTGLTALAKVYSGRFPTTIVEIGRDSNKIHPTQKPVALLEWLIKTYSNPGDTILDPTMGSGTAGVACVNTKRNFIGIEKDTHYCRIANQRIEQALREEAHGPSALVTG